MAKSKTDKEPRYAGFWIRVAAIILDGFVLGTVGFIFGMVLMSIDPRLVEESHAYRDYNRANIFDLISFLIGFTYHVGFNSSKYMGTIGKVAVGIAITDGDGGRISVLKAVGRYFAYILSAIPLMAGYIMVAFHPQKRAIHDIICNTYVIYKKR